MVLLLLECGPPNVKTLECLMEQPTRVFTAPRHPIWMIGLKAGLARRMTRSWRADLVPRTTFSGRRFSRRSDRLSESSDQHDERPRGSGLAWQKRLRSGLRGSGRASMSEFVFAIA